MTFMVGSRVSLAGNLLSYIKEGNNDEVISIIENGNAHRLSIDNEGRTLLHYAASYNNPVVTQYLIDKGWKVDAKSVYGQTPLMMAVIAQSESTIKILLDAKANVIESFDDKSGSFLLEQLKYNSTNNLKILKMLFDNIVSECLSNNDKAQKLFDMHCPFPAVVIFGNVELTKLMLDRGFPVDGRLADTNETALHVAVKYLDIGNVKLLVEQGAKIDAKDYKNRTPLSRLEMYTKGRDEKLEILRFLLDRGASLTAESSMGRTVGSQLLRLGDSHTVRILTSYIDLSMRDQSGYYKYLHDLAYNKNPGVLEVLQRKFVDINARDHLDRTLLDIVARHYDVSKVQFLLDNGAKVSTIDDSNATDLRWLVTNPHTLETEKVIELFLQYGANVQFSNNKTILHYIPSRLYDFVKLILAHLAR